VASSPTPPTRAGAAVALIVGNILVLKFHSPGEGGAGQSYFARHFTDYLPENS
jgi:hypothetical protein